MEKSTCKYCGRKKQLIDNSFCSDKCKKKYAKTGKSKKRNKVEDFIYEVVTIIEHALGL